MFRLIPVVLTFVALAGCKTENKAFCENPTNAGLEGCPGDASNGGVCSRDSDCMMSGFPVCDTGTGSKGGRCVQCTDTAQAACKGALCINDMCQPCTQHAQCPSHACLPDGTCADASQVAYVRPSGMGTTCTDEVPCKTVNAGINAKSIVKVTGIIVDDMPTIVDGKAVQILADPGAMLKRTSPGVILDVRNDQADVRIYDLEITGGMGMKTDPTVSVSISLPVTSGNPKLTLTRVKIDGNPGIGIVATAGTLTVTRSAISHNAGGGISITGAEFDITNNFITGNGAASGGAATLLGGIAINQIDTGTRKFEFNTVADNSAAMNLASGVNCTITQSAVFSNNIVFDNISGTGKLQIGGNCNWTYSDIGESGSGSPPPTGQGNINADPLFTAPGSDYHLKPNSPAKNTADNAATLNIDFDGNSRPQENRSDMGADEALPTQ